MKNDFVSSARSVSDLKAHLTFPVIFLIERSLGFPLYRSPILPSAIVIKIGLLKIDEKLKPLCCRRFQT